MIADYTYASATETLARTYVNGSQYIDERVVMRTYGGTPASTTDDSDHYYLHEELYTVAGLARANGSLEEAYTYDTYGEAQVYEWPLGDNDRSGVVNALDRVILCYRPSWLSGSATDEPWMDTNVDGLLNTDDYTTYVIPAWPARAYSPAGNPFLFTGRLTDTWHANTTTDTTHFRRMQDNRNRSYDPKHGRWLQRDQLGTGPELLLVSLQYSDGSNLYEYVKARPLIRLDPSGMWSWCCDDECPEEGDYAFALDQKLQVAGMEVNPAVFHDLADSIRFAQKGMRWRNYLLYVYKFVAKEGMANPLPAIYSVSWWYSGVDIAGMIEDIEKKKRVQSGATVWTLVATNSCVRECCGLPKRGATTGGTWVHTPTGGLFYKPEYEWEWQTHLAWTTDPEKMRKNATQWIPCKFKRDSPRETFDNILDSTDSPEFVKETMQKCAEQAAKKALGYDDTEE